MGDERTTADVQAAADRLTRATTELTRLMRRKEFLRELHERGNWLAKGPAESPEWVRRWSDYWEGLKSDRHYQELLVEARAALSALETPEFLQALEEMKYGERRGVEGAIAYLEADPWYFRSGYLKGRIARWLRQVELTEVERDRLRAVVLSTPGKGSRYEQVEYRKLGRRLDTPGFRARLRDLSKSGDPGVARRASLVLAACELNNLPGRDLRGAR